MSTINPSIQAMNEAMLLDRAQSLDSQAIDELSSGSKILSPVSDPAGVATVDTLGAANDRLGAASTNVQSALSYAQASSSDLSIIGSMLSRMGELATAALDPTKTSSDNANYQDEFGALQNELRNMIGGSAAVIGGTGVANPAASFQGDALFGSTAGGGISVEIGDGANDVMTIADTNLQSGATLALMQQDANGNYGVKVTDSGALAEINAAIAQVNTSQTNLGGVESRLSMAASMIQGQQQDNTSSISSISDVDVAQASTQVANFNVLMQSSAAMLAQANLDPQAILKLLKGG